MAIDEETKGKIIDLYSAQHKTIREITRITKKSSRDITAILREQKQESREQKCEVDDKHQGQNSMEEPLNQGRHQRRCAEGAERAGLVDLVLALGDARRPGRSRSA